MGTPTKKHTTADYHLPGERALPRGQHGRHKSTKDISSVLAQEHKTTRSALRLPDRSTEPAPSMPAIAPPDVRRLQYIHVTSWKPSPQRRRGARPVSHCRDPKSLPSRSTPHCRVLCSAAKHQHTVPPGRRGHRWPGHLAVGATPWLARMTDPQHRMREWNSLRRRPPASFARRRSPAAAGGGGGGGGGGSAAWSARPSRLLETTRGPDPLFSVVHFPMDDLLDIAEQL